MGEHPMACAAWREALAGWLVAQQGPAEEAALVAHLDGCPACRTEADRLLAVAAVTLGADLDGESPRRPPADDTPPADLGDRIAARVAAERRPSVARRAGVALAAIAAVVALAVVWRPSGAGDLDGEAVAFRRLTPGAEASAVVAPEGGGSLVALTATGLDPGVTYALWLTPPGGGYPERVAAGTFRPDASGEVDARLRSALPASAMGRVWATAPDGEIVLDTEPPEPG